MTITEYINGKVVYDKYGGQQIWIQEPDGGCQLLADVRGWGHIQNLFSKGNTIDIEKAAKFQDEIGRFIADAINEKISRLKSPATDGQ